MVKIKNNKYFPPFYRLLSFKLFLVLLVIIVTLFGIYSAICYKLQSHIYENTVALSAYRMSDLAKNALYRLMLLNKRDELYQTIRRMGDEPGIVAIRIYNKKGVIKFSSREEEIGKTVDMNAEACYICHSANQPITSVPIKKKSRIFYGTDGQRIMGLINPIRNAPTCSNNGCHAHSEDQTILGVLDVTMSLGDLDKAALHNRLVVYSISVGLIIITIFIFAVVLYWGIHRPIHHLQKGMVHLSVGELDYRIDMKRKDELGMLAQSFNNMAANLKDAYDRMLQVEKIASLGKMAATVAHELNNPLSGIVTYSKLLQKRVKSVAPPGNEKNKMLKDFDLVISEAMRCGNIVRNLLEFAHSSTSTFRKVKLQEVIARALSIVHHHMELVGVQASSQVDIHPETISCDPDQILQALVALFVNAIEAMPNGGKLTIRAYNSPDNPRAVRIEISDTGRGIPEDIKDRIFEPFFTTKKEKAGIGLGLAVVCGIVQHHKGKMWLDSEPGKGTTFYIELPFEQPVPQTSNA